MYIAIDIDIIYVYIDIVGMMTHPCNRSDKPLMLAR